MTKDEERLLNQAHDSRLIHLNDQLIFPLLKKKESELVATLCQQFKDKGTVGPHIVALITAYRDIGQELASIARRGESAVVKLHTFKED